MDASQKRIREIVHRLLAEAAADERSDRFVLSAALRDQQLAGNAQLARDAEERRSRERRKPEWKPEKGTLRERVQAAVAHHVRGTRGECRDEPIAEPELTAQRHRRRLLHEQRVRSTVNDPAVESLGADHTTGP